MPLPHLLFPLGKAPRSGAGSLQASSLEQDVNKEMLRWEEPKGGEKVSCLSQPTCLLSLAAGELRRTKIGLGGAEGAALPQAAKASEETAELGGWKGQCGAPLIALTHPTPPPRRSLHRSLSGWDGDGDLFPGHSSVPA